MRRFGPWLMLTYWVAVTELKLNDHNPETLLFTRYLYDGNFPQPP